MKGGKTEKKCFFPIKWIHLSYHFNINVTPEVYAPNLTMENGIATPFFVRQFNRKQQHYKFCEFGLIS